MDELTNDTPDEDAKTELSFDLRPRYPFGFAPKYVPIDILTVLLTPRSSGSAGHGVT